MDTHLTRDTDAQERLLLVGDLGSAQATLAVVSPVEGPRVPLAEASFPMPHYPNFTAMVREFLTTQHDLPIHHACFDVAGPVIDGRATLSNLPGLLDESVLTAALHLDSVRLLNDLEALAWAVPHLEPADLMVLNPGVPAPEGTLAVIGPGTGLGEAYLFWIGSGYRACASEGGHADFAPTDDLQSELLAYMRSRFDHVSYERVCSGPGIQQIYDFLGLHGTYHADGPELIAAIAEGGDPAALIIDAALRTVDTAAASVATLDLFLSILGAEAGNLALKVLATGGIYLGGDILLRMQPLLRTGRFMQAFRRKGRASALLGRMPVQLIVNAKAPLLGAAYYGFAPGATGAA